MPIFARRRLQAMLTDIAPLLDDSKTRDLVRRLENKRVDQVLPAEMELSLQWALAQVGDLEIEPPWWESANRPDASSKVLIPGETSVIEIAAPNDNAIGGEEAMDAVALRFIAADVGRFRGDYFSNALAPDRAVHHADALHLLHQFVLCERRVLSAEPR